MSTSPEDRLVNVLSHWLAHHLGDDELRDRLADELNHERDLAPEQAEAVAELRVALDAGGSRQQLEVVVRETLEALALG